MSTLTDAVANLDLSHDLLKGDMVVDAFIIARLINEETGAETFLISANKNMSVIVEIGLINAAHQVVTDGTWDKDDD